MTVIAGDGTSKNPSNGGVEYWTSFEKGIPMLTQGGLNYRGEDMLSIQAEYLTSISLSGKNYTANDVWAMYNDPERYRIITFGEWEKLTGEKPINFAFIKSENKFTVDTKVEHYNSSGRLLVLFPERNLMVAAWKEGCLNYQEGYFIWKDEIKTPDEDYSVYKGEGQEINIYNETPAQAGGSVINNYYSPSTTSSSYQGRMYDGGSNYGSSYGYDPCCGSGYGGFSFGVSYSSGYNYNQCYTCWQQPTYYGPNQQGGNYSNYYDNSYYNNETTVINNNNNTTDNSSIVIIHHGGKKDPVIVVPEEDSNNNGGDIVDEGIVIEGDANNNGGDIVDGEIVIGGEPDANNQGGRVHSPKSFESLLASNEKPLVKAGVKKLSSPNSVKVVKNYSKPEIENISGKSVVSSKPKPKPVSTPEAATSWSSGNKPVFNSQGSQGKAQWSYGNKTETPETTYGRPGKKNVYETETTATVPAWQQQYVSNNSGNMGMNSSPNSGKNNAYQAQNPGGKNNFQNHENSSVQQNSYSGKPIMPSNAYNRGNKNSYKPPVSGGAGRGNFQNQKPVMSAGNRGNTGGGIKNSTPTPNRGGGQKFTSSQNGSQVSSKGAGPKRR